MEHVIAGLIKIMKMGQSLTAEDEVRLDIHLDGLLAKIRSFADVNAAGDVLDQLGTFQTDLATVCFKWQVPLPPRLRSLVRQFDRSDDLDMRSFVFQKIKVNNFCVATDTDKQGHWGEPL